MAGNGFFQHCNAEVSLRRVRQLPGQDLPAGPVHNRNQIKEAASHRDVGHAGTPYTARFLISAETQFNSEACSLAKFTATWFGLRVAVGVTILRDDRPIFKPLIIFNSVPSCVRRCRIATELQSSEEFPINGSRENALGTRDLIVQDA